MTFEIASMADSPVASISRDSPSTRHATWIVTVLALDLQILDEDADPQDLFEVVRQALRQARLGVVHAASGHSSAASTGFARQQPPKPSSSSTGTPSSAAFWSWVRRRARPPRSPSSSTPSARAAARRADCALGLLPAEPLHRPR